MSRLALWSFLMATAHGAGLMVMPMFVGASVPEHAEHGAHVVAPAAGAGAALAAAGVHALGYLAVTAVVAVVVFERLGVGILRRAWFNTDVIWSAALIATGALTLLM